MKTVSTYLLCLCAPLFFYSQACFADKPSCTANSGGYCQYTGYVKQIYVNKSGMILIYYDTPFDTEQDADVAGYSLGLGGRSAAVVLVSENPEFAKLFYSTALSAQATKRKITIQMRGTHSGYLKADRIWLPEE